jgi:hypothetical protein
MSTATASATPVRKRTSATTLRLVRKTHLYFGLFISPALLFFAFTGAVQTLNLHEVLGSYKPPMVVARLAQVHKTQTPNFPPGKGPKGSVPEKSGAAPKAPQPEVTLAGKQKQHLPMKIFFLVVALGLLTSTTTGVYMSYKYERNKLLVTGVLVAGVVVPLLLLKF